jgi:hypothetical protein
MNCTIRVELEPRTRTRVLGLKGRCREWVSRVPAQTSTDSGGRKRGLRNILQHTSTYHNYHNNNASRHARAN